MMLSKCKWAKRYLAAVVADHMLYLLTLSSIRDHALNYVSEATMHIRITHCSSSSRLNVREPILSVMHGVDVNAFHSVIGRFDQQELKNEGEFSVLSSIITQSVSPQ